MHMTENMDPIMDILSVSLSIKDLAQISGTFTSGSFDTIFLITGRCGQNIGHFQLRMSTSATLTL